MTVRKRVAKATRRKAFPEGEVALSLKRTGDYNARPEQTQQPEESHGPD